MKRAQKWIGLVLAGVGVLLALALGFTAFLVFTTPGAELVLAVANGRELPLRAQSISGTLARRFELHGVELRAGPVEASVDTVVVVWRPLALRAHRVDVTEVLMTGARIIVHAGASDSTQAKASPPSTAGAGWNISAARVRVRNASLDAPGGVRLREVDVIASGGPDGYRGDVRAAGAAWRFDDFRAFVRVSGNTQAVTADSIDVRTLGGVVRGDAFVRWTPAPSWRARLEGDSLRVGGLARAPEDWLGSIAFRARGTGVVHGDTTRVSVDLKSLEGSLRDRPLSARGRVDLDGARISASDAHMRWGRSRATLSGSMADIADVTLDADIPSLAEILPNARGSARVRGRITGTPERFEIGLEARGQGVRASRWDIPDLDATVKAIITAENYVPRAAEIRRAEIRIGEGRLETKGKVSWRDGVAWNVTVAADHFETSTLIPARWKLYGPVSVRAASSGLRRGKSLRGNLTIDSLSGMLRDRALDGSGKVDLKNGEADITQLQLVWGDLNANVDGHAGEALDLEFDVVAPDLSILDSAWRGAVSIRGHAEGPRRRPSVDATVTADSVRARGLVLGHLDGHVDADPGFARPVDIHITAQDVRRGESAVDTLRVDVSGPREGHRASLFVAKGGSSAALALRGAYTDSTWSGWIDDVQVRHPVMGQWHSSGRAPVFLSHAHARLDSFVVTSANSRLSAEGAWSLGGHAHARVELDGEIAHEGNQIEYSGEAVARADSAGVSAHLDLELTEEAASLATVSGNLSILGYVVGRDSLGTQPIEGRLDLKCPDIGPVLAVFAHSVAKSSGSLTGHLTPNGTAGDFSIEGKVVLEKARFDFTNNLRLRDTQLTLVSVGDGRVSLDGRTTSGGGRVSITASSARSEKGWINGTFAAKGERFQLINEPDVQVFVSPDIQVRLEERTATVTGDVLVPFARIETTEVPATAAASSPDVIIVEDTLATRPTLQVHTKVRVALGDSVNFSGFGLRARMAGSIVVDDERGLPTRGTGEIQIVEGKYRAYGNELTIDNGRFIFGGGPIDNPGMDIRAYRGLTTQNVMAGSGEIVGVLLRGSLRKPEFSVFSNPPMSESEIMSYLIFGRPMNSGSSSEQSALSSAAMLFSMQQGNQIAGDLGKRLTLDDAYLESGSEIHEASFVAGKYLSPKLYVSYAAGLFENTNTFRVRYSMAKRWTLQAESGKASSTDILYWFERGK